MDLSVIVCPVDFSASGEAALRRALALARWQDAALHVLYVRPGRSRRNAAGSTSTEDPFLGRLVAFISSANAEGIAVTPVVLTGDPVEAVAEYARAKSADLIVVGQNGRRGSRFWSSGVLARDIARAVSCPTLTVSKEAVADADATASFNNILCGIDFSAASLRALNEALTIAQHNGGRITLLHVLEGFPYETVYSGARAVRLIGDHRARVDKIRRELRALVPPDALNWCEVDTEVVSGIPHDAIRATATERQADLVVIGVPPRTRRDRIVMASTVSNVLRRSRRPVLAVPEPLHVTQADSQAIGAGSYDAEAIALLTWRAGQRVAPGTRPQDIERHQ
jgi:nucleotide-binding universal stress UspA family protein